MARPWSFKAGQRSLTRKILLLNTIIALATASVLVVLKIGSVYWIARQDLTAQANMEVRLVGETVAAPLVAGDLKAAHDLLGALHNSRDVRHAGVYDTNGRLFTSFQAEGDDSILPALPGPDGARYTGEHLLVTATIVQGDRRVGHIVVAYGLGRIATALFYNALVTALVTLVGFGLVLFGLYRYMPRVLRPLRELSQLMGAVARNQDYRVRASPEGSDEVAALATGFNSMLDQIEARDTSLRRELAERRRAEEQLRHIAHHDPVTGLPNRHFFNGHVVQAVSRAERSGRRLALLMLDLDNFKSVNDTYGHQVGDYVLAMFAQRLQSRLRGSDTACRLGGDEFAFVVEDVAQEQDACAVAEKLQHAVREPFVLDGKETYMSASIGIVLSQPSANDLSAMMRDADTAMYQAKVQGKGSSQLFHPAMNMRAAQRMTLESALREAIEKDELQLHYQPQIEIRSGTIVSVEALLRWRNPDLGIVHPGEFIALAEKTGLIVLLGDWVLRTALRDAIRWQAAGLPETAVAINVSPHQLAAGHFLSTFIAQLELSQIDPSLLEIELTESVLVEGSHASTGLWQLAERGVKLVIDDFGTGCSSMSCFRQLPLSHLKIDGSFIHAAIATGVITSAHNLGLIVAAEGVERPEDLEALRAHRCDRAQGFLLGNPMPVEQLLELSRTPALKTAAQVVPLYANARGG